MERTVTYGLSLTPPWQVLVAHPPFTDMTLKFRKGREAPGLPGNKGRVFHNPMAAPAKCQLMK